MCASFPAQHLRRRETKNGIPTAEFRADPRLLFTVARVLQKQSKWGDSISCYQLFIDSPLKAVEQKQRAKEHIERCRTQLATTPTPSASPAMPQSQQNGPGGLRCSSIDTAVRHNI